MSYIDELKEKDKTQEREIKIISFADEKYGASRKWRRITRYYRFNSIEDLSCANFILKKLKDINVEFGEFCLVYEYDHCDYKGNRKFDNYEGFLTRGGLLSSTEDLSNLTFEFDFDGVEMVGTIGFNGNSLIIDVSYDSELENGEERAKGALDKLHEYIKEPIVY